MDISDAFVEENIESAGIEISDDEVEELQAWLTVLAEQNVEAFDQFEKDEVIALLVQNGGLCFMAGQAYQARKTKNTFPVEMSAATASAFMSFLVDRSSS